MQHNWSLTTKTHSGLYSQELFNSKVKNICGFHQVTFFLKTTDVLEHL